MPEKKKNATPLSERLIVDRKATGMSQTQVAAKLVTSTTVLSGWENGNHKPSDDYLFALAELYGADPLEYVRLRMISPSSGKAGQRSKRYREQLERKGAAAPPAEDAAAEALRGATAGEGAKRATRRASPRRGRKTPQGQER